MKKKIAFYLPNFDNGGATRVILNLLQGLEQQDLDIYLFLGIVRGEYIKQIPQYVKVVNINAKHQVFAVFNLIKYINTINPQILVSNGLGCNINVLLAKIICRLKCKIVTIEHNKMDMFLEERKKFSFLRKRLFDLRIFLARYLYRYIDVIVAVSCAVATDSKKYSSVANDQLQIINNPIVIDDIEMKKLEVVDHPWFHNKTEPIILAVGRLASEKRFDILIKAFYKVNKERKCKLVILGDGPEKITLRELITELKIEDSVDLIGYADNPYKFMRQSDIVILSSITEGFPMVLLEAMACKCKVIATRCGGPEEILSGDLDKYLVPVEDVNQLASKIEYVLNESFNDKLLKRAQEFDIKVVINKYLKIFNSLLASFR